MYYSLKLDMLEDWNGAEVSTGTDQAEGIGTWCTRRVELPEESLARLSPEEWLPPLVSALQSKRGPAFRTALDQ